MDEVESGLFVALLGVPEVRLDGCPLPLHRRLVRALFYYIAAHAEGVTRDQAAYVLSPKESQWVARRRLTRLLSLLRADLGPRGLAYLHTDGEHLRLDAPGRIDVHRFTAIMGQARLWRNPADAPDDLLSQVEEAVLLYRGEFLSGFSLPQHGEYELWMLREREHLHEKYVAALAFLARAYALRGEIEHAITWARRALEAEPVREDIHRLLMHLYALSGRRADALAQYEECVLILEKELGVDPLPETRALYRAIFAGTPPPLVCPQPLAVPRIVSPLTVPFVGREDALDALGRCWQRVCEGRGQIVLLEGEPGIGKTRLVEEFCRRARAPILWARVEPTLQGQPYHPLQYALAPKLPTLAWEHLPLSVDVLAEVSRILPDVRMYRHDLPIPLAWDPRVGQSRLFVALIHFLKALVTRPTVLFVDDVHWAEEDFLSWLTFLAPRVSSLPLLVILAYRTEETSAALHRLADSVKAQEMAHCLTLTGLSTDEVAMLIDHVRSRERFFPQDLAPVTLRDHTGGNPYFLLETLRWLQEHPGDVDPLPIPEHVHEVIRHRIERLPLIARQVLNAAAVLSPYITVSLLARTAGRTQEETRVALDDLVGRGLLVPTGEPWPAYRFVHEQLHAVTYDLIGVARRRHLHRRAAEALRVSRPWAISNLDAALARHWEAAGEVPRAVESLLAAMERAAEQFAYGEVEHLASRALALVERLPAGQMTLRARLHALLGQGRARRVTCRYVEALSSLEEARHLAEVLGDVQGQIAALDEEIHIALDREDIERAQRLATVCLQQAQVAGREYLVARALYLQEMVAVYFGLPSSPSRLDEALRIFEAGNDRVRVAEVWNLRGVSAMMRGNYKEALRHFDRALALARHIQHYHLMHRVQANRGHVLYNMGNFPAAWEAFVQAETWLESLGLERPDLRFALGMGYVALHLGRTEEAEAHLTRAAALAKRMGFAYGRAYVWLHLAELRRVQGRMEEAASLLQRALEQLETVKSGLRVWVLEAWGRLLREQGRTREALRVHRAAARLAHEINIPRRLVTALCEIGRDLLCLRRTAAAVALFRWALHQARERGEQVAVATALIGLARARPEDREGAEQALRAARESGSLILLCDAADIALRTFEAAGDRAASRRLRAEVHARVQEAGWADPFPGE